MNRQSRGSGSMVQPSTSDIRPHGSWSLGSHSALRTPNSELPAAAAGLYIHIPFCRSKCPYCDFYSITDLSVVPGFLDALHLDIKMHHAQWGSFDTLYLGGGTPSAISTEGLEQVIGMAREHFVLTADAEVTLEMNPGDLGRVDLSRLRHLGVNRLSIGVQSLDDSILRFLGRRHTPGEAISAIESARATGFENLGIDLIYGVPGQGMTAWINTLKEVVALGPEHLSCYELTVEDRTPLGRRHASGDFTLPSEEMQRDFFMRTSEFLEESGYVHYEVSNFACDPSLTSRHNQKYWNHTPYLGLGPSAHSFDGGARRWWNHRSVDEYVATLRCERSPVAGEEILTLDQMRMEALYLGLRTRRGISFDEYARRYGADLLEEKRHVFDRLKEDGLLTAEDGSLRPTRAGLALADAFGAL
jgi:oxygen-independent coproporphyrinogen III oxidase